jgi:hypothetical protein
MQFGADLPKEETEGEAPALDQEELALDDVSLEAEELGGEGALEVAAIEEEELDEMGEEEAEAGSEVAEEGTDTSSTLPGPEEEAAQPDFGPLVLSGHVGDEKALSGQAAILDLPVGDGRVILFSFNPLHRYLNHSDFRLVWNIVLNWNDLP